MATTIKLYLIRHAIAAERGEAYPDDALRPLTSRGRDRFRKTARGLAELGVTLDRILTSPLVRARQTADLLAEELLEHPLIVEVEPLAPGGSYAALLEQLAKHARCGAIALVGHEPGIGEVAARFVGARAPIPFKKGAVCRIDIDALPPTGQGQLRWFLPPGILRALA